MGMYNIVSVLVPCCTCGVEVERRLQLHYGAKGLHEYRIGDRLDWGRGRGRIVGNPSLPRVWCPCYAEDACPGCGYDPTAPGFAVVIAAGAVSEVVQAAAGRVFPDFPDWTELGPADSPATTAASDD